jgi:hypothetical protein
MEPETKPESKSDSAPKERRPRKRGGVWRWIGVFLLGVVVGGYLFRDVRPRSFLAVDRCDHCWEPNEVAGLAGAVGVLRDPNVIPGIVIETSKSIAFVNPGKNPRQHYVVVPKKDIPDAGAFAKGDEAYLIDAYAVMGQLAREMGMRHYTITTRGPGEQTVRYLHFHLVSLD